MCPSRYRGCHRNGAAIGTLFVASHRTTLALPFPRPASTFGKIPVSPRARTPAANASTSSRNNCVELGGARPNARAHTSAPTPSTPSTEPAQCSERARARSRSTSDLHHLVLLILPKLLVFPVRGDAPVLVSFVPALAFYLPQRAMEGRLPIGSSGNLGGDAHPVARHVGGKASRSVADVMNPKRPHHLRMRRLPSALCGSNSAAAAPTPRPTFASTIFPRCPSFSNAIFAFFFCVGAAAKTETQARLSGRLLLRCRSLSLFPARILASPICVAVIAGRPPCVSMSSRRVPWRPSSSAFAVLRFRPLQHMSSSGQGLAFGGAVAGHGDRGTIFLVLSHSKLEGLCFDSSCSCCVTASMPPSPPPSCPFSPS